MVHESEVYETITETGGLGIHVRLSTHSIPYRVATFDGPKRISSWKAALQKEDEILFAKGMAAARGEEVDW